jgi:branched-chain amino acid transport system substrate-binding protein
VLLHATSITTIYPRRRRMKPLMKIFVCMACFSLFLFHSISEAQEKTILVGQAIPLSGSGVLWGDQAQILGREAVKLFNEAGGITIKGQKYFYKLVTADTGYTAKGGSEAANKLVYSDKIDFMTCSLGSTVVAATQVVTEPKKIITFASAWGTVAEDANYTFRLIYTPKETDDSGMAFIKNKYPGANKIAMIAPNDSAGVGALEYNVKLCKALGYTVTFSDYYEKDTTEFYPVVTRILATKPDIIHTLSPRPGSHGPLLKAIYEQGYRGILLGCHDVKTDVDTSGESRAEGIYTFDASAYGMPGGPPLGRYLDSLCLKETKNSLGFPPAVGWDGLACLHEALFRAQTLDSDSIVATIKADDFCFNSTYGVSTFGGGPKRVQIMAPTLIGQIQKGQLVIIERSLSSEAKERLSHCKGPFANYPKIPN